MGGHRVSQRADRIAAFEVMDVVRAANERDMDLGPGSTCHLEVGQPCAPTPSIVLDAARAALGRPLGYTDSSGTIALRNRISAFYRERHGLEVGADRIAVTSGASAGCVLAFLALADVGGRIAVCEPGYPCYRSVLESLGVEVTSVRLDAAGGYLPTSEGLQRAVGSQDGGASSSVDTGADTPLDALVVASPSNPTGTVLSASELGALHGWCAARDATLVVDEIYHGTASSTLATAAAFDDAVVVQSFSKYFCMTGWRLGWLVLPEELVRPVERLAQNLYLSPHALSQEAAIAAFDAGEELDSHASTYHRNRDVVIGALRGCGVEDIAPARGAFYVWADMSAWGRSGELCRRWLDEIGVACTPGGDFDPSLGERFVRFSVAGSTAEIDTAVRRLTGWLDEHPREVAA